MSLSHEQIRNRYPAGTYSVNGESVTVQQLKVRSMNFGQHWRSEQAESIPFELRLPLPLAIDIINWQLPEYVADARQHPDEESLLERLLKAENWNTDAMYLLNEGPDLLRQLLLEEYAHEMIMQWFGDGPLDGEGYVLNSCNEVSIEDTSIAMKGYCRHTASSSAYQDF